MVKLTGKKMLQDERLLYTSAAMTLDEVVSIGW